MAKKSMIEWPRFAGLAFSLFGIILTILLVCKHMFPAFCTGSMGCEIDGVDGCAELGDSAYSSIFGVPIALLGLFYYSIVLALFLKTFVKPSVALTGLLFTAAVVGILVDLPLFYLNYFVLSTPCTLCAYTYIATIGIFIAAFFMFMPEYRAGNLKGVSMGQAIKEGLVPAMAGLVFTVIVLFIISLMASSAESEPAASDGSIELLPAEYSERMIEDLTAFSRAELSTDGLTSMVGSEDGYIIIHKYADFLCPFCYDGVQLARRAHERWPGRLKVYYRNFPLDGSCNPMLQQSRPPTGEWRCNAAYAAICASNQGLFPDMYYTLFELQKSRTPITMEEIRSITEAHNGDWATMQNCMQSPRTERVLQRDIEDAGRIGINATPTVIVNGRKIPGGLPRESYFMQMLDALVYEQEGQAAYDEYRERQQ